VCVRERERKRVSENVYTDRSHFTRFLFERFLFNSTWKYIPLFEFTW